MARITMDRVSLTFHVRQHQRTSFKEYIVKRMFRRSVNPYVHVKALEDFTLDIPSGERLGVIGHNGAGKSTLLKVISRVIQPTRGSAVMRGTLSPILELGTGFDRELTGLENIYLNALLLGRTRREVLEAVDGIVEFSGLGDFVRAPIRNYSSGMLARLGFSVATAWVPDIMILDEVLAVGDAAFVHKCEARLRRFHEAGTTVLMVSHNAEAIRHNCTRAVWLDAGELKADGPSREVLAMYKDHGTEPDAR
jgi:ABC-2 type transport system ATP-binding protein